MRDICHRQLWVMEDDLLGELIVYRKCVGSRGGGGWFEVQLKQVELGTRRASQLQLSGSAQVTSTTAL